jgi:hypothetical protein
VHLKRLVFCGILATSALTVACSGGYASAYVMPAPPPPRVAGVVGYAPGPGYVWVDGFWDLRGSRWNWVDGRWARPPRGRTAWVADRWERHGNHWRYNRGHWR